MKKPIVFIIISLIFLNCILPAYALEPYYNYTYSKDKKPELEPSAYVPYKIITGESAGTTNFNDPKDIVISKNGTIYICDSGNNRIVVTDTGNKLLNIISEFEYGSNPQTFNKPEGIFVTDDNELYVADTGNGRIVAFDSQLTVTGIFSRPKTELISDDFNYEPVKIVVDNAKRLYIVSKNINQGIIELNKDGTFSRFFGAIKVNPDIANLFWKSIATGAQKERMNLTLPTEYSSICADDKGFIYGTVSATGDVKNAGGAVDGANFIKRLNSIGNDILLRDEEKPPMGDLEYITVQDTPKTSKFIDICSQKNGIYSALDSSMGRVFTYDSDGNLLYVFGGYGERFGEFGSPSAIDTDDTDYYIADNKYNQIIVFKPTKYGEIIVEAANYQFMREYEKAEAAWEEALKYTTKSDKAFVGLGKALYKLENYKSAMKYFKLGNDKENYSKAFKDYRRTLIEQNFKYVLLFFFVLIITAIIFPTIKRAGSRSGRRKKL